MAMQRLAKTLGRLYDEHSLRDPASLKLYPSESGKCQRQIQYKALGIPGEPFGPDVIWKLAMGDMVELALMYVIMSTPGLTVIDNNKILQIKIGGVPWRGASDGVLVSANGQRRNVEVKSTSGIGFKMTLKNGVDNAFGYLTQASVYMRQQLEDGAINVPETIFVYIDRDSMHMAEFVVKYDESLAREADRKFLAVTQGVQTKKMVPRGYELNSDGSLGLQCNYCSHKMTCWTKPHQVVTFKGTKPEYKLKPTQELQMIMSGKKPKWYVV